MTPKKQANHIFYQYYMILFESDSDKGEEIIVSILAKKCAIRDVQNTIAANPENIEFWQEVLTEIKKL